MTDSMTVDAYSGVKKKEIHDVVALCISAVSDVLYASAGRNSSFSTVIFFYDHLRIGGKRRR